MPLYSMGKILKNCRKRKNITQEQLCEGICTPSALSKFENGHKEPTYVTFASLMERMGEWPEAYDSFMGEQSYEIQELMCQIRACEFRHEYRNGMEALDELEKILDAHPDNVVYRQFFELSRIVCETRGHLNEKQIQKAYDILKRTVPSFGIKPLKEMFLNHQEIITINAIAIGYGENGKVDEAIALLTELKEYLEQKFIGERLRKSIYTLIIRNREKYLGLGGYHEEAIQAAYEAIDSMRYLGEMLKVSDLYYSIAWNYMKMDRIKYAEKIEDAIVLSLHIDIGNRYFSNVEETIRLVKKNMPELFDKPNLCQSLDLYHRMAELNFPIQK